MAKVYRQTALDPQPQSFQFAGVPRTQPASARSMSALSEPLRYLHEANVRPSGSVLARFPSLASGAVCALPSSSANRNTLRWNSVPDAARLAPTLYQNDVRLAAGDETMLKISEAIRSTSDADGTILLDIRHGRILGLNRMGSAVFQKLERGLTPAEIAGEISREFPVNSEQVRADVLAFIESLEKHNVLRSL